MEKIPGLVGNHASTRAGARIHPMHVAMTSTWDPCASLRAILSWLEWPFADVRNHPRLRQLDVGSFREGKSPSTRLFWRDLVSLPDRRFSKGSASTARGLGSTTPAVVRALATKTLGVGDHGSTPGREATALQQGIPAPPSSLIRLQNINLVCSM